MVPKPVIANFDLLMSQIDSNTAVAGIVGLGYVGLPLAVETARSGFRSLGYDVNGKVVDSINSGRSHILDIGSEVLKAFVGEGLLSATTDASRLSECDTISICVPTPLSKTKDPDLSYVISAAQMIADTLRPGQLIILESTTFPGTTRDVVLPILQKNGLVVGVELLP
jgi:UDP-N-acetyl-D-glucosamine dehydrogenase